jgi:hypothetical protein
VRRIVSIQCAGGEWSDGQTGAKRGSEDAEGEVALAPGGGEGLQTLFSPQPAHLLPIHQYALVALQVRPRAPEPVQWVLACVGA